MQTACQRKQVDDKMLMTRVLGFFQPFDLVAGHPENGIFSSRFENIPTCSIDRATGFEVIGPSDESFGQRTARNTRTGSQRRLLGADWLEVRVIDATNSEYVKTLARSNKPFGYAEPFHPV